MIKARRLNHIAAPLFLVFLLAFNSCKAREAKKQEQPIPTQSDRYVYFDRELPFVFTPRHPYGDDVYVGYGDTSYDSQGKYHARLYFQSGDQEAIDFFQWLAFGFDLYDSKELDGYIKEMAPFLANSTACLHETPYTQEGIKSFSFNLINLKESKKDKLSAKLYSFKDGDFIDCEDCLKGDNYWIVIDKAPGLPQGKSLRIRVVFPVIYYWDTLYALQTKQLKQQVTQMMCESAKSFTWVDFGEPFQPELWKKVEHLFPYPKAIIHISDERKKQ